jgi:glutathione S-transferase
MKLFSMPGPGSLAAHIVLEWTRVPYEDARGDHQATDAAGAPPLLLHRETVLAGTVSILRYLAELHPHLELLGHGTARSRAEVMLWLAFLDSDVQRAFEPLLHPGRPSRARGDAPPLPEPVQRQARDCLRRLDAQLQGQEWLTGMRSLADVYLFALLRWTAGKTNLREFRNLASFVLRMHGDPGVRIALVLEAGLMRRSAKTFTARQALDRLDERLRAAPVARLKAEIVGNVEYRQGEGVLLEVSRGIVHVEVNASDTVLSWVDESFRGEAAIPYANFSHYVAAGAIRLLL